MKRIIGMMMAGLMLLSGYTLAAENEMGHTGGVSEGSTLPRTIEKYVNIPGSTTNSYQYKEVVFISGEPVLFEGTIEVAINDTVIDDNPLGSYGETYTVAATNADETATLERTLDFTTYYRVIEGEFKKQITTESLLNTWTEEVNFGDATYTIDNGTFEKTGIRDITPGVSYHHISVSYLADYTDADGNKITVSSEGANYGFDQPWSKVETQEREMSIDFESETVEDMVVETTSTAESKKTIYYDATEPYPISFDGTYNQRMEREGTLTYKIKTYHKALEADQYEGSYTITTANQIEKLPIPENLDFLQGHWAEDDLKKLYSMEIFTEMPHSGMQYEAISRGDFIKALCLAMNIDTAVYEEDQTKMIFGDVTSDHPLYPYVMAAYDKKLVKGTGENFDVDRPINREEAFVIYIRIIGLERLGVTDAPLTPFIDDSNISDWAKKEIMAGYRLGIIKGDDQGYVKPKQYISKAEAAAIINRLIDYLREDIAADYVK